MNGLLLLALLVAGGMGVTGVYYRWKAGDIVAQRKAELAAAPSEAEPRVERWLEFGRPLIHQRLVQLRLSAGTPWLVTHAVQSGEPEQPPVLWGVDLSELAPEWARREGVDVIVELPPAGALGRAWVPEDKALYVPRIAPDEHPPDAAASAERARSIAEHALAPLRQALPRDISGAELVVRVGQQVGEEQP